ncbi:NAD(P)/FAD-dependent oxidoreductase [Nakamurella flavida]|uniref:NADH:ubiquinone reductase (non-electrogenic) n=1 Tax=Nakamurella flavida TaxID=363630 RepID=A0A939C187_9ACTN|nr:NAD(P)/FAD-dependent oxidoreductase [Nakamurella flavida]MBM9475200.1 NAD(P)/FAD-dependent oxidoreductase [Nakamurella flavida]MDP9776773.1 NADH dehydrogenase [Nakamurella flavida]
MSESVLPVRAAASARRRPHVVIVGGGFAGLSALRSLQSSDVDITLVDRHTYNAFQPLLYQVATAGLNPGDVTFFLRAARMRQRNVSFRQGLVTGIDTESNELSFQDGATMSFDYLILASGATTNYFGTKGAEENSLAIYTRAQALTLRDRIFTNLEHAAASNSGDDVAIVVVGAGPTGVEMAGALAELRNDAMAAIYPELDPRRTHIVLVEMTDKVLGPFAPSLREYAAKALRERGVELRLNTSVAEVREDGVLFGSGEFLKAGVVIWATGVAVPKIVGEWGMPQGRGGRITTDADLRVTGFPNIFAVGDVGLAPDPQPQLAQPALQGGKHAGKQIAALVTGRPTQPFVYHDKGTMATVGRRAAVADIALPGKRSVRLTGTIAWLVWLFIHIIMLLGNRNRLATLINLTTKYLAPSRRTNPIVGDVPVFEHQRS